MTYLQLRQTAEQVKYSSGKNEYRVILSSDSSPQKRSLRAWGKVKRKEWMDGQEIKWTLKEMWVARKQRRRYKQGATFFTSLSQWIQLVLDVYITPRVTIHHLLPEHETLSQAGGGNVCECSLLAAWRPPADSCSQWEVWWSECLHTALSWRPRSPSPGRETASGAVCQRGRPL